MNDDGQALVEFALVLPVLLVVAFAMVQLADLGVARLALVHAAAEGARIGALTNDDELVRDGVAAAAGPLDPRHLRVEIVPAQSEVPRAGDPRGSLLRVRLRYTLPLALPALPLLTIETVAARHIEWTP
ncbi:MAG TPA: TadE/TadG family type IV pilus assembly protein [Candidatus Limnocylindria bacterium]|nr:TadE/TadG family type IV pilus assembly protein [Candidatus Limnocylindria bacterium]